MSLFSRKKYSIRQRLIIFIVFTLVLLSGFTLYISGYFTRLLRKSTYDNAQSTLSLYNSQLSRNLENFEIFLYDMNQYTTDLSSINVSTYNAEIYSHIMRLKRFLDYTRPSFQEIDAVFLYAPLSDTFIQSQKYSSSFTIEITSYLKNLLRSLNASDQLEQINTASWFTKSIGDNTYMLRIINAGQSYIGSWSDITTLTSSFDSIASLEGHILYLYENGKPVSQTSWADTTFDIEKSLDNYSICKNPDGEKFLLSTVSLDYCDYYLAMLIPLNVVDSTLKPIHYFFVLIILALLLMCVIIISSVSHFISTPLHSIEQTAQAIHNGTYTNQIAQSDTNCMELLQINRGFNNLLSEIDTLKINIYEEKVAKAEFELRSLKSQVAPHFLINCMNGIFSLIDRHSRNYDVIQKMVTILSKHLRYALSDNPSVSLGEEMSYIDNYIELTKLRFPGCLTYRREIAEEVVCASIFPLMILSLTENAIKHNLTMGEPLLLSISAFSCQKDGREYVHLIHVDSGSGFSPEMLDILSAANLEDIRQHDGHKIGLFNTIRRFRLIYPSDASIRFSNEPDMGARIDMIIPISSDGTDSE